jgi:hypothetical protein
MFIPQIQAKVDPKTAVGIWLFDEGKGKTVSDLSGNKNDGEIMGNPSWEKGKFGTALQFGEQSDWVQVKDHPSLRVSDAYSVMAWVHAERYFFPGTQWQGIIAKANNPRSFSFYTDTSKRPLIAIHFGGAHIVAFGTEFPLKEWTHLAFVVESGKNGGKITAYTNGKLVKETQNAALNGLPGDSDTQDVVIGRTHEGARFFGGLIDEVALFNTALTEDDMADIVEDGLSRTLDITAVEPSQKLSVIWSTLKTQY